MCGRRTWRPPYPRPYWAGLAVSSAGHLASRRLPRQERWLDALSSTAAAMGPGPKTVSNVHFCSTVANVALASRGGGVTGAVRWREIAMSTKLMWSPFVKGPFRSSVRQSRSSRIRKRPSFRYKNLGGKLFPRLVKRFVTSLTVLDALAHQQRQGMRLLCRQGPPRLTIRSNSLFYPPFAPTELVG